MQPLNRHDACPPTTTLRVLRPEEAPDEPCLPCGIPIESLRVIIKALHRVKPAGADAIPAVDSGGPADAATPAIADNVTFLRKPLSQREQQVLEFLVQGATDKEVADALGLSRSTVQSHVGAIHQKTGALNRVHLGVAAVQLGLVPIDGVARPGQ